MIAAESTPPPKLCGRDMFNQVSETARSPRGEEEKGKGRRRRAPPFPQDRFCAGSSARSRMDGQRGWVGRNGTCHPSLAPWMLGFRNDEHGRGVIRGDGPVGWSARPTGGEKQRRNDWAGAWAHIFCMLRRSQALPLSITRRCWNIIDGNNRSGRNSRKFLAWGRCTDGEIRILFRREGPPSGACFLGGYGDQRRVRYGPALAPPSGNPDIGGQGASDIAGPRPLRHGLTSRHSNFVRTARRL